MSSIEASLRLEITQYQQSLARATAQVRKFKEDAVREAGGLSPAFAQAGQDIRAMLPAAGVAAIVGGVRQIIGEMDDLADTALKLNEGTETLQRVGYVAGLSGSSLDAVAASALKLEKALGEVENKKAAEALANLGITGERLASMPLDDKLIALADAFQQARTTGTGYNDLLALMGKSAGDLIPLLSASGEELRGMFAEAPVLADSAVQGMAALNDEVDAFITRSKSGFGALIAMGGGLLDMLGGASFGDAFGTSDDAAAAAAKRDRDRQTQAAAQEQARLEAALAAERKEAEAEALKQQEEKQKRLERIAELQESVTRQEIARLDPADQLVQLTELQRQKIDEMRAAGGLFFDATVEGMAKFAQAQAQNGSAGAEETLRRYQEVLRIQQQITSLNNGLRDEAAGSSAAEARAKAAENEAWWNKMIAEEKERQAQADARRSIDEEIALLQAKATGQTRLVEAMERELEIRRRTQEIMARAGMGEEEARAAAARIQSLQEAADRRTQGDPTSPAAEEEKKSKIMGYSWQRQGGAYERQDHLYGPGAKYRVGIADAQPGQEGSLAPQAQRNAVIESQRSGASGGAGLADQAAQIVINSLPQILSTLTGS